MKDTNHMEFESCMDQICIFPFIVNKFLETSTRELCPNLSVILPLFDQWVTGYICEDSYRF